jgi:type IV pilus assembly protein PilW
MRDRINSIMRSFFPLTSCSQVASDVSSACRHRRLAAGFSLIELMVALVIAGVLLLGLASYFVSASRNFAETERTSRQVENGRYASALLSEDVRHAGFYGEVSNVVNLPVGSAIAMPADPPPDPCLSALASVKAAVPLPIQGLHTPGTTPSCLPDYLTGTDVLVVRRSNTIPIPVASAVANGIYTQVGFCQTAPTMFTVDDSGFTLTAKDCATVQPIRQYHVHIYYIAKCAIGTGAKGACATADPPLPTLKRAELRPTSEACSPWCLVPLVEGIENMQVEYGLDTKVTKDGSPTTFVAGPTTVLQWSQVVATRLHLLARNTDATPGFVDTKTYTLGGTTITPGGAYRRHAYTELVRVQNVSQRIEAIFP